MQSYPRPRVHVFSPIRSGSTLVFNWVRSFMDLKRADLYKTHSVNSCHGSDLVIRVMRHPLDSILSSGFRFNHPLNETMLRANLNEYLQQGGHDSVMPIGGAPVLTVYYKDISGPFASDTMRTIVQTLLENQIPLVEKISFPHLLKKYSLEAVGKYISKYRNFGEYCHRTHFHGDHIGPYSGRTDFRKLLSPEQCSMLNSNPTIQEILEKYPNLLKN